MVAAIALGSNLGDRRAHLDYAADALRTVLSDLRISRYYETEPVGVQTAQALFLNAAAVGATDLTAPNLLGRLLDVERARGRERPYLNAPRTLDLDLILLGDLTVEEPGLTVPHPRFRERRFVLEPLAEIAPEMRDPVTGRSIAELLRLLTSEF